MTLTSIRFDAQVWTTRPDAAHGLLAIELRDTEARQARFALLDLTTATLRFADVQLPEPWWVGLAAVAHGCVLVHQFTEPTLPIAGGLWALDDAGALRWHRPEARLRAVLPEGFWVEVGRPEAPSDVLLAPDGSPRDTPARDELIHMTEAESARAAAALGYPEPDASGQGERMAWGAHELRFVTTEQAGRCALALECWLDHRCLARWPLEQDLARPVPAAALRVGTAVVVLRGRHELLLLRP